MNVDKDSTEGATRVHSTRHAIDILALLVVTTAYAIAFTLLRSLAVSLRLSALVIVFLTLIAISQALLFHGMRPRASSLLAGSLFFLCGATLDISTQTITHAILSYAITMTALGAFCGYMAGVFIGFTFWSADLLRSSLNARSW